MHEYIIGKSGVGKSTFLENHALENEGGFAFLDPHRTVRRSWPTPSIAFFGSHRTPRTSSALMSLRMSQIVIGTW